MASYKLRLAAFVLLAVLLTGLGSARPVSARPPEPSVINEPLQNDPPTPEGGLPASAAVENISGYGQLLALSCESRAAADWARHFGVTIHELDFFFRLPKTANPETGFVGSVNGGWGNLPPQGYGVHAAPVAALLRDYGASAVALRDMTIQALRAEIAAGRPVIVWVTGHVEPGAGVDLPIDGHSVRVARYEHTVIVTGYSTDKVTILDGRTVYQRSVETFMAAWAPLQNMAIIWDASLAQAGGE